MYFNINRNVFLWKCITIMLVSSKLMVFGLHIMPKERHWLLLTTLKQTPGMSPTVWPLRPNPTTRTSLFSSMKYEQSSLLEQLHGRKPGCLTLTSTGRGYAKWVFLELLFMPLLVLSVVQNVLAGLRLWHSPFLLALLTWAKDQSSTGSLANFLVDVNNYPKKNGDKDEQKGRFSVSTWS